jgi:hypothetical protein
MIPNTKLQQVISKTNIATLLQTNFKNAYVTFDLVWSFYINNSYTNYIKFSLLRTILRMVLNSILLMLKWLVVFIKMNSEHDVYSEKYCIVLILHSVVVSE